MRVISGARQCGKSTKLVELAKATNGYIMVHNKLAGESLIRMGMPADRVLNVNLVDVRNLGANKPLYVDNIELCLQALLLMRVAAGTISLEKEDIDAMINQRVVEQIILNPEG